jgi:hypothetical protein
MIQKKPQSVSISVIIALVVGSAIVPYGSIAFATQQSQSTTSSQSTNDTLANATVVTVNKTTLLKPGNIALNTAALDVRMLHLTFSNKPKDIATLAYIWGFPLVTMQRQFNFVTSPNVHGPGRGPANTLVCARSLVDARFTDIVSPNSDTLYCVTQFDLKKEPVVLVVPPIAADRYYTFEFLDAYTNDFAYVGTRATGSNGGTYLIAGPNWNGQVPQGMTKIWSPTNLAWFINRILVKGPADVTNVNRIQDKIIVKPLSVFQGNAIPPPPTAALSNKVPIGPQPSLIAPTGIKIYDEIGQAMIGNPLNPPDPGLVAKIASVGIGPGKTPSTEANATIKAALQTGITEGQKAIDAEVANAGTNINGWRYAIPTGDYGTDYLFRAAVTQIGLGANIAQESLYPVAFTDSQGKPLTGTNNYTIHFNPGQTPPVKGFWSITMYNNKSLFVNNPINRYSIGKYTEGLKNNTDGSLDIYIQHQSPGKDKESNWLPADKNSFNLILRMYLPAEEVLNGTWTPPPITRQ